MIWRKLISDIGSVTGATVLLALVGAGATIILARLLPVDQFGRVSVLLLIFNLTSTFDAVRPVTIFFANRHRDRARETFASIFWIDAAIGGSLALSILCLAFAVPIDLLGRSELVCIAGVFMLFFLHSAYWGWADAHGLVASTALVRGLGMSGVYLIFVVLAANESQGLGYALALLVAAALMLFATWWVCRSHRLVTRAQRPSSQMMKLIAIEVRRSMQFNLATLVLATTDRLAVYTVSGSQALGIYSGHFDLATKPMALVRAAQAATNPHATQAAARNEDIFPVIATTTKFLFLALSGGVWTAIMLREWVTNTLLGPHYSQHADVFAILILAQCFVLFGYSSALLLNASGNFLAQKRYYSAAAVTMLAFAFPAMQVGGLIAISITYLIVRLVDVGLLLSATRALGRRMLLGRALLAGGLWLSASAAAWTQSAILCVAFSAALLVLLWRIPLTRRGRVDS